MKGTVQRPHWPAPASKSATQPAREQKTRQTTTTDPASPAEAPIDPHNRITLAVLEEFSAGRWRGYDPYNTPPRHRPRAAWDRKRKRD
jgi:hypothetical protein